MPGIFGAVGCDRSIYRVLRDEFAAPWQGCESAVFPDGILGGHAFQPAQSLHLTRSGVHCAVDGETSIYRTAADFALNGEPELFRSSEGRLDTTARCKGNVVVVEHDKGLWYLATDWTGTFPLYYSQTADGLLFCNRQKPLARVLGASPDWIGIREFFDRNYTLAGRSFFEGIYRLLPGQILTYNHRSHHAHLRETSRAWAEGADNELSHRSSAAEATWTSLIAALTRCLDRSETHALMMSGGWDSRTMLAAIKTYVDPRRLTAYTHGDVLSAELALTGRMCRRASVALHQEPLTNTTLKPISLQREFHRVETVLFPEWHRAGEVLAEMGVRSISTGLYGEVVGGHYGATVLASGFRKIPILGAQLLKLPHHLSRPTISAAKALLRTQQSNHPWFVKCDVWGRRDLRNGISDDLEATLRRLDDRSITCGNRFLEAFITEHRGLHFTTQLLSCRAYVDVAIPFGDREFLNLATRIPLSVKIHNSLNHEMLAKRDPDLLRFSTGATLVPAGWPIMVQEASRVVRYTKDHAQWALNAFTRSLSGPPHSGWWNWEFLRNGSALDILLDDFRGDFWNKDAMRQRIAELKIQGLHRNYYYPAGALLQGLLKGYNVDLMLR
jgi:hypothetical protein